MKTELEEIFQRHPHAKRDSLIPILQEIQEAEGFLSETAIVEVGNHLHLPTSKIYGVATFYNQFRFQPKGKYNIQVCRGTACHVLGSSTVLNELEKYLKIKAGQTSRDNLFSIEVVACIGACGLAPVIAINGEFHAKVTPKKLSGIIAEIRDKELSHAKN